MTKPPQSSNAQRTAAPATTQVQEWLRSQLAMELEVSPGEIQIDTPILSYGVDSMQQVSMIARLEDQYGFRFASNPLDDHPTIQSLAEFIAGLNDPPNSKAH